MSQVKLVSPNELYTDAKKFVCPDREPDKSDWAFIANHMTCRILPEAGFACFRVACLVLSCPLSEDHLEWIWNYGLELRAE